MTRKFTAAGAALLILAAGCAPAAASSAASPEQSVWGDRMTCTTDTAGYCEMPHPVGVVPDAVTAGTFNRIGAAVVVATTSTTVRVRLVRAFSATGAPTVWASTAAQVDVVLVYTPAPSGPTPSAEPTTEAPTAAPTTVAPTTAAPTTAAPPAGDVWPTPTTTGVPAGVTLTDDSRCTLATAGEFIYRKRLTCPSRIAIAAGGVVIRESEVPSGVNNWTSTGGRHFAIIYSTVGPATGCFSGADFAVGATDFWAIGNNIRNVLDGFRHSEKSPADTDTIDLDGPGPGAAEPMGQNRIVGNHVDLCYVTGAHGDGFQANGTDGPALVERNVFDLRDISIYTAGLYWESTYRGGTLRENLFRGNGAPDSGDGAFGTVLAGTTGPGHTVTGNVYAEALGGGAHNRSDQCGNVATWSGNTRGTVDTAGRVTRTTTVNC